MFWSGHSREQTAHAPNLWISLWFKDHTWSREGAVDVVSIYDNPKMLLNSASGIESGHQVSSQDSSQDQHWELSEEEDKYQAK